MFKILRDFWRLAGLCALVGSSVARAGWVDFIGTPVGYEEAALANSGVGLDGSIASPLYNPALGYDSAQKTKKETSTQISYLMYNFAFNGTTEQDRIAGRSRASIAPLYASSRKTWSRSAMILFFHTSPNLSVAATMDSAREQEDAAYSTDLYFEMSQQSESLGLGYSKRFTNSLSVGFTTYLSHRSAKQLVSIYAKSDDMNMFRSLRQTVYEAEDYGLGLDVGAAYHVSPDLVLGIAVETPGFFLATTGKTFVSGYQVTLAQPGVDPEDTEEYSESMENIKLRSSGFFRYKLGLQYKFFRRTFLVSDITYMPTWSSGSEPYTTSLEETESVSLGLKAGWSKKLSGLTGFKIQREGDDFRQLSTLGLTLSPDQETVYLGSISFSSVWDKQSSSGDSTIWGFNLAIKNSF